MTGARRASPWTCYADLAGCQQVCDNDYLASIEHPCFGQAMMVGAPVQLSETPGRVQGPASELGQDTDDVLASLDYNAEDIQRPRGERSISGRRRKLWPGWTAAS
jgi:crotonobetainyl-CoA:carnitine CoA-transferase CaiB-like acyl-CoA transferase